jgi:hypothetical protein
LSRMGVTDNEQIDAIGLNCAPMRFVT